jgi:sulfite reductase alpha subunit-like flavoprotein
MDIMN